jgi:hypothetical protein
MVALISPVYFGAPHGAFSWQSCFQCKPFTAFLSSIVLPAMASKSVQISTQHGISLSGAYVYTLYGTILIHQYQLVEEGYAFGRLAVKALEANKEDPLACPILKVYASHIQVSLKVCLYAWKLGNDSFCE